MGHRNFALQPDSRSSIHSGARAINSTIKILMDSNDKIGIACA